MAADIEREIREEREKLDELVDKALADGTPIAETFEIMRQCEKVNHLILERERRVN
jgi:hypothetical protein